MKQVKAFVKEQKAVLISIALGIAVYQLLGISMTATSKIPANFHGIFNISMVLVQLYVFSSLAHTFIVSKMIKA